MNTVIVRTSLLNLLVVNFSCSVIGDQSGTVGESPGSCSSSARALFFRRIFMGDEENSKTEMDGPEGCSWPTKPVEETVTRSSSGALVLYSNTKLLEPFHLSSRTFQLAGRDFLIKQNWNDFGVAAVVWDAAVVLCKYLESETKAGHLSLRGKRIIELGAGTGLVGMVAAALNGETTVTDRESVLEQLQENIRLNFPVSKATPTKPPVSGVGAALKSAESVSASPPSSDSSTLSSTSTSSSAISSTVSVTESASSDLTRVKGQGDSMGQEPHQVKDQWSFVSPSVQTPRVRALTWGENLQDFSKPFDIILGADIIYIEESFPALLQTLVHLSDKDTLVLLSCRIRYDRDTDFLQKLRQKFEVTQVLFDEEKGIHVYSGRKLTS